MLVDPMVTKVWHLYLIVFPERRYLLLTLAVFGLVVGAAFGLTHIGR